VECFCEHGNEPSGFIGGEEIVDQLSDSKLLRKSSASLSYCIMVDVRNVQPCQLRYFYIPTLNHEFKHSSPEVM